MRFLSYESKFGQLFLKFCYGCYLNILWLVCCLPVFTIGASTTALYYACLKIARGEETSIAGMFFRAFKQNFRQATVLWLILLPVGLLLGGDIWVLWHLHNATSGTLAVLCTLGLALVVVAAIAYAIVLMYVFPLVASVSNTNFAMLKNSFFIGTHYLFCTILVFAVHFAMFVVIVRFFTPIILFAGGLCAVICAHFLYKVIDACSYDPNKPQEEDA